MKSFRALPLVALALAFFAGPPLWSQHQMPPGPKVAILLFDGVQIIDFTGPYEVFGQAGFPVLTVAPSAGPITTSMGMKVTPTHTLADAPATEILLLPGGGVDRHLDNPELVAWIRQRAAAADHVDPDAG